ncbi:unnamed protein product [Acanthoscelides obtectus]|uniref:Uncharacterized protein n=1 Tax=Acanthoscelides obtectus TaxID=200917 RepID=A0A9P0KP21_ACAOB|nr:unnamed protein product [Acanthoscelides obtectus]CAK1623661.1 hypothetical protein AOBTE_LOCUS2111 [Acanthoscelides obtectus]
MSTLNRIASFLKPSDKKPAAHKLIKPLDRDTLRNIEISNPIPQTVPGDDKPHKAVVMRAQSMRVNKAAPKPNIQTFGSMRQPAGYKRPLSIPFGARPKSPPPPRPNESNEKDNTKTETSQYDDCLNKVSPGSCSSSDNIYAVIEESPKTPFSPAEECCKSGSSESMGLLGEIVSEIENRTSDSIYSTSTLARKKKEEAEAKLDENVSKSYSSNRYENTSVFQGGEYSDMSGNVKSSASSTYSGYILPSAVKGPTAKRDTKDEKSTATLSTFKSDVIKPIALTVTTMPSSKETIPKTTPPSFTNKVDASPSRVNKSKTSSSPNSNKVLGKPTATKPAVANINSKRPLPARPTTPATKLNRSTTNSPDLVTSCNTNTTKQPDVLGNSTVLKKPAIATVKPVTSNLSKPSLKPTAKFGSGAASDKKTGMVNHKGQVANKQNVSNSEVGKTTSEIQEPSKSYVNSLAQRYDNKNNSSDIKIKAKT